MKKFYLFMASLLSFATAWAQGLPTGGNTPEEAPAYLIQNTRNGKNFAKANNGVQFDLVAEASVDDNCEFKFVNLDADELTALGEIPAGKAVFKIYSAALKAYVNDVAKGTTTTDKAQAQTWYVFASPYVYIEGKNAYVISKDATGSEQSSSWNNASGGDKLVAYWEANDPGSGWYLWNLDKLPKAAATPAEAPVYYLQNTRNKKYFAGAMMNSAMTLNAMVTERHQFKFITTGHKSAFKIYSVSEDAYVNDVNTGALTTDKSAAQTWYVSESPYTEAEGVGAFAIGKDIERNSFAWNNVGGGDNSIGYWSANDPCSCWYIETGDDIVEAQKTVYTTALNGLTGTDSEANLYISNTKLAAAKAEVASESATMEGIIAKASPRNVVNTSATGLYHIANSNYYASAIAEHKTKWLTGDAGEASRTIWRFIINDYNSCYILNYLTGEYFQAVQNTADSPNIASRM